MKKNIFLILSLLLLTLPCGLLGQSKLPNNRLKVVIENNTLFNLSLREAVENNWKLCKYDFCTMNEFEELKCDTTYYFLMKVNGIFKRESDPSIEFLTLFKGGPAAEEGLEAMYDVLSLPLNSVGDDGEYIMPYLGSYINIFQTHLLRTLQKRMATVMGISWYSNRLSEIKDKKLMINQEDLSSQVTKESAEQIFKGKVEITEQDAIEEAIDEQAENCLVSLSIAPEIEQQGSYCYKMLISTDTHEIFYYRKEQISARSPKGFQTAELKKIAVYVK